MANDNLNSAVAPSLPRVLVVDDHREARIALAKYLSMTGFSVSEAPNGQTAIQLLQTDPPFQFLLTDLNLSDIDGFQVARAARERWPSIWIALITGWSFETEDAGEYGIDQVLFKPIDPNQLIDILNQQLGGPAPS